MQHVAGLWVHAAAALVIHVITGDDGPVIPDTLAGAGIVFIGGLCAENIIVEKRLAAQGIVLILIILWCSISKNNGDILLRLFSN